MKEITEETCPKTVHFKEVGFVSPVVISLIKPHMVQLVVSGQSNSFLTTHKLTAIVLLKAYETIDRLLCVGNAPASISLKKNRLGTNNINPVPGRYIWPSQMYPAQERNEE